MVEFDCGDCDAHLVAVPMTSRHPLTGGRRQRAYRSAWLACPACGAAWEQDATGAVTKRRESLNR
jgi:hypothetical protein